MEHGDVDDGVTMAATPVADDRATVAVLEAEINTCRTDSADLLAALKKARYELDYYKVRAANVLVNRQDPGVDVLLTDVLDDVRSVSESIRDLYQGLLDLQVHIEQRYATAVESASDGDTELIAAKLNLLIHALQQIRETQLFGMAPSDTGRVLRDCRVLTVNNELGVVVLNAGHRHGVRAGSIWTVDTGRKRPLRLRLVEVRHALSAGIVVDGRIGYAVPGLRVRLVAETTNVD